MLINVGVLRTGCIILPPAPSVLQEASSDASDAGVKTRRSVRRTSGLVQTPLWEVLNGQPHRHLVRVAAGRLLYPCAGHPGTLRDPAPAASDLPRGSLPPWRPPAVKRHPGGGHPPGGNANLVSFPATAAWGIDYALRGTQGVDISERFHRTSFDETGQDGTRHDRTSPALTAQD